MNDDDDTNIEPVDLSPTRAERIARVRARGRRIRARRRLAISGLTAVVVLAIAVPAVAIGTRSPSGRVTPAAVAHAQGDFRIAVVLNFPSPPCPPGSLAWDPPVAPTQHPESVCLQLGDQIMNAADVHGASVVHDDSQGWIVNLDVDRAAVARLAAEATNRQAAFIVNDRVISAPVVNPGITGTTVTISPLATREQAIELATEILGRAPSHVDASLPALVTTIELPGSTFVTGSDVHATVVIDNTTDAPVTLEPPGTCHLKWAVSFTNTKVPNGVAFTDECSTQHSVVQPGINRFPTTVSTTYMSCLEPGGVGQPSDVHCLPDGGMPRLPPGDYQAVLTTSPGGLLSAPPITVHLIAEP